MEKDTQPSKAFSSRLERARRWREGIKPQIRELFRHCAPSRQYDFDQSADPNTIPESDVFHSLGEELAMDLASDLVTYFTPAETRWAEYNVISPVNEDDEKIVRQIVSERESELFDIIQMSNYNDIAPQWGFEAATHGTPALWVTQAGPSVPMHVESVPPHELLITPGHQGYLDRFREMRVRSNTVEALTTMPGVPVDLSDPRLQIAIKAENRWSDVIFGYWLDWSDPARPMWMTEVTVDGIRVSEKEVVLGDMSGSCPLVVGRFNPQPRFPWGRGPGLKALPDLMTLDKLTEIVMSGLDGALQNTFIYADDGFLDMSEGLEMGRAYPAARGFTREQIYELGKDINVEQGTLTVDQFEYRIRRGFYQDQIQRGDTPPSATQYIEERRRTQQRIGKPSAPLWTEMFVPFIQRVEYLGVATGRMPEAISHNGADIVVMPISPLQKAQNADKLMITNANLQTAFNIFQDQVGNFIDPVQTFGNMVDASGDELLVIREQEETQVAPTTPPAQ